MTSVPRLVALIDAVRYCVERQVAGAFVDLEEFSILAEARFLADTWRDDYNAQHPHSALGMMAPSQFAASWQQNRRNDGTVNPELSEGADR